MKRKCVNCPHCQGKVYVDNESSDTYIIGEEGEYTKHICSKCGADIFLKSDTYDIAITIHKKE